MAKRNYTHMQAYLPQIQAMIKAGKTQCEIVEHFGSKMRVSIKIWNF